VLLVTVDVVVNHCNTLVLIKERDKTGYVTSLTLKTLKQR
jgi:hypothetical protein